MVLREVGNSERGRRHKYCHQESQVSQTQLSLASYLLSIPRHNRWGRIAPQRDRGAGGRRKEKEKE